jgi:dTMP kinase
MARAAFLALEGLDGTGKSTQCKLLAQWLRGRGQAVTSCADPGGTALGDQLRTILLHHRHEMAPWTEAFLFMASRAQLVAEVIEPALAARDIVVSDRFLLSNVVYQGHARGLDPSALWQAGLTATGGRKPDLTLVLDLPPEQAEARRGRPADRVEARGADYHARVRSGFVAEARSHPDTIRLVDATGTIQQVHATICREVAAFLGTANGS